MTMKALEHLRNADHRLSKVIDEIGVIDYTNYNNCADSFQFLTKEIVGQMISANVKKVLLERLFALCNSGITPSAIGNLTIEQLRGIGLSQAKSSYLLNLAKITGSGEIDFGMLKSLSDDEVIKILTSIRGIGNWTAKMYLIFYLNREDVLPYEDSAFLQAYKWLYNTKTVTPNSISRRCRKWKPYTSIGARYMYRAIDCGLTKISIKDFLEINVNEEFACNHTL